LKIHPHLETSLGANVKKQQILAFIILWDESKEFLHSHHCHITAEITAGQQMSRLAEMQHQTSLHKHLYEIILIQVD
jgi:hypothetical protein